LLNAESLQRDDNFKEQQQQQHVAAAAFSDPA